MLLVIGTVTAIEGAFTLYHRKTWLRPERYRRLIRIAGRGAIAVGIFQWGFGFFAASLGTALLIWLRDAIHPCVACIVLWIEIMVFIITVMIVHGLYERREREWK